jgi:hypothetical protein
MTVAWIGVVKLVVSSEPGILRLSCPIIPARFPRIDPKCCPARHPKEMVNRRGCVLDGDSDLTQNRISLGC